jgi:hypothetical protein
MFVNDTSRLPESGRVCVAAFRQAGTGPASYYSLLIESARATVESMPEPRNPAHVLGVGARIESVKGPAYAAYFAASRGRFEATPNYQDGLYVLVDGAVYAVRDEKISTRLRRGLTTREFTLLRADRPQRSVEYPWPWYREPFASALADPGKTADFLRELAAMVRAYA